MHNETPVVLKTYDFYRELYSAVEKMPKKDKYTLGEKAQRSTLDLMELLILAGNADKTNKPAYLNQAAAKLDLLKLLVRLTKDLKTIPTNKYLFLEENLQEIGRMIGGWIKSLN